MGTIGRYNVLFQLGAGGMAEVFLAHEVGVGGVERLVVIKRVLPQLAQDDLFMNMLLNEGRISTRLNHPNIAHVYEVGQAGGHLFIAMEFVHGVNLRAILRRSSKKRLSPPLVALIGARVAAALHHAHVLTDLRGTPLQVVHRDVSPDNIHISYEGTVKVLDFGVAKAKNNIECTTSGVFKGKYSYMSPEQAKGLSIDCRSDIFSLGIVLHECLTYRKLIKRTNAVEMLQEIVEGKILPPSAVLGQTLPEQLERIVMRALEKKPNDRYESAREMQEELQDFLRQQPATETDLEAFLATLFGNLALNQQKLREALEGASAAPLALPSALSISMPSGLVAAAAAAAEDAAVGEPATTPDGRSYQQSRALRLPRNSAQWAVVASVVLLVAAVVIGWLALSPRKPATAVQPAAPRQSAPTALRAPLAPVQNAPRDEKPKLATVVLKSTPPGASVLLPGRGSVGETPAVIEKLPAGVRTSFTVTLARHEPRAVELTLQPGEVRTFEVKLVPAAPPFAAQPPKRSSRPTPSRRSTAPASQGSGLLTLDSEPWALVFVDGHKAGVTPIFKLKLSAGPHELKLRNPDLNLVKTLSISVPKDGEVRRSIKL